MAVEVFDPEKLAKLQAKTISGFFGTEVPNADDWLFKAIEANRKEKLFDVDKLVPYYFSGRQLAEGVSYPGLKHPLDPWLYDQIRAGYVAADADRLPVGWGLLDVTKRPPYDNGRQMYPDMPRLKELLADLRERGQVTVPDYCRNVRADSRFALSPDEIDGKKAVVAKAVAASLGIKADQVAIPLYVVFNYIGNLDHPEFGQVNTSEWLRDNFRLGGRLRGGGSDDGGLSSVVGYWGSDYHDDDFGFRLQISSPDRA